MSSIAGTMKKIDEREGVTSISANARIDYILRFSQHAVLVIDDDTELCTQVGNHFLGSLTKEHNAAYVSLSSKLNDIQIRCRIIEQLFGNTLFDPEQPLSVNVIKLSDNNDEVITIVIGNSEHMSLQLFHELCQLSETANKLKKTVNVVFLGNVSAGQLVSDNYSLFDKKLSIIQAKNGQVISFSSSIFKNKSSGSIKTILKVCVLIFILAAILILIFVSDLWGSKEPLTPDKFILNQEQSLNKKFVNLEDEKLDSNTITKLDETELSNVATAQDVFHFLTLASEETVSEEIVVVKAENLFNEPNVTNEKKIILIEDTFQEPLTQIIIEQPEIVNTKVDTKLISYNLDEAYYKSLNVGVVIQFASFDKLEGFRVFINTYPTFELKGYARKLNNVKSHIITSKVFENSAEAKLEIENLPQGLKARGPWIKSIQAINNEINLYQDVK